MTALQLPPPLTTNVAPYYGDDALSLVAAIDANCKVYLVQAMELQAPDNYQLKSVLALGANSAHGALNGYKIFGQSQGGPALNQTLANADAIVSWDQYATGRGSGLSGIWLAAPAAGVKAGLLIKTQHAIALEFEKLYIGDVDTAVVQQGLTGANGDQLILDRVRAGGNINNFFRWETGVNQAVGPSLDNPGGLLNPGGVIFDWQAYAANGLCARSIEFSQNNGITETGHSPFPCTNSIFIRWINGGFAQVPVRIDGGRSEWVSIVAAITDNGQGGSTTANVWDISGIEFTHNYRLGNPHQLGLGAISFSGAYAGSHKMEYRGCVFAAVDTDPQLAFPIYLDPASKTMPTLIFRNCHWVGPAGFKPTMALGGATFPAYYEYCTAGGVAFSG
jgi:hypothetical protein